MKILLMYEPDAEHLARLRASAPQAELVVALSEAEARSEIRDADAVLGNRHFHQSLPDATRLRWMQSNSAGTDLILERTGERDGFVLTSSRGVYDDEMAEHAVALVLALLRDLHGARDRQKTRRWERTPLRTLRSSTVLILGWGSVGRATGRLLAAFGASVKGVRRSPSREQGVLGPDAWRDALKETDILLLALPSTAETHHLVSRNELFSLRSPAFVVNIGRGATLDTAALVEAIDRGIVAGAGLDVFEEEPLCESSLLWNRNEILVTPHVGRSVETARHRWQPLFEENLRRFAAGEPLLNVVERKRGY